MAAAETEFCSFDYTTGSVVWYRSSKQIGWWPCVVSRVHDDSGVHLKALGDGYEYKGKVESKSAKLRPFVCPKCESMIQDQLKRFHRTRYTNTLRDFVTAVKEALELSPSLKLDIELPSEEQLALLAKPKTPDILSTLKNNSDVFTPGTSSADRGSVGRRSLRHRQQPTTPTECHSVPLSTTERARGDILVQVQGGSGRKRPRLNEASPYSNGTGAKHMKLSAVVSGKNEMGCESESSESDLPTCVRRRLDLDQSIEDDSNTSAILPDILTACEPVTSHRGKTLSRVEITRAEDDCGEGSEIREGVRVVRSSTSESEKVSNKISVGVSEGLADTASEKSKLTTVERATETSDREREEDMSETEIGSQQHGHEQMAEEVKERGRHGEIPKENEKEREEQYGHEQMAEGEKETAETREQPHGHGKVSQENSREGERQRGFEQVAEVEREIEQQHGYGKVSEGVKKNIKESEKVEDTTAEEREEERMETGEGESSESDDDDLPLYQTKTTTKVVVNELKGGDHVWFKWSGYPHWPALVIKSYPAKNKTKAKAIVVFFGDDPDIHYTVKHSSRHNLTRYVRGTQEYTDFMRAGHSCGENAEFFLQAVKEAESFITAKCNKELSGTSLEMFRQICEKRPPSMVPPVTWMERSSTLQHSNAGAPRVSAFGFRLDDEEEENGASDEESNVDESETEEEDSVYTLDKILKSFTRLKPILTSIMKGATPSEYHRIFTSGTAKEQRQLSTARKFGPCERWKTAKKLSLIRHLQNLAEDSLTIDGSIFRYAGDVLLPEAMARTISAFEGIPEQKAWAKL